MTDLIEATESIQAQLGNCDGAFDMSEFCSDLAARPEFEVKDCLVRRREPYQPADEGSGLLPAECLSASFAGVLVIGCSQAHAGVPAVLLGGRLYTGKQIYEFCDFGGGVDREEKASGQHYIAAYREFVEELFALEGDEAKRVAEGLWADTRVSLVGGRPILNKAGGRYLQFVVPAEAIVASSHFALCAPGGGLREGASAIDLLLSLGRRNQELTSVALVSLDELMRGAAADGVVAPLVVRSLDDKARASERISLRGASKGDCMVGEQGSIAGCSGALRGFKHLYSEVSAGRAGSGRMPVVWDMELGDPDDIMTLLLICAHPRIELKAVTITPGSCEQVSLVRWVLKEVGLGHVRVGAQDWPKNYDGHEKDPEGFYNTSNFGRLPTSPEECEPADRVLLESCDGATTLVTGAQLHNLAAALALDGFRLGRLVGQGGFVGEGVAPAHLQMPKFADYFWTEAGARNPAKYGVESAAVAGQQLTDDELEKIQATIAQPSKERHAVDSLVEAGSRAVFSTTSRCEEEGVLEKRGWRFCPSWNFGKGRQAEKTSAALASPAIARRVCVSKNVCHRTLYDATWNEAVWSAVERAKVRGDGRRAKALGLLHKVMTWYGEHHPKGKKIHDPLALAVALDESVCELREVVLERNPKNDWGARLAPGSGLWMPVDYSDARFKAALLEVEACYGSTRAGAG